MADGASRWYAGRWRTPAGIERRRAAERALEHRRLRMGAGGIRISLGYAPTVESAAELRKRIKKEAPRA